jgi:hypothetical protein
MKKIKRSASRSISRILSPPEGSGRPFLWEKRYRFPQATNPDRRPGNGYGAIPIWPCFRWGLPCLSVAGRAVRSYRTVSPLPVPLRYPPRAIGGLLSVALSVRLPCPGVTRHRVSVKSGLSSLLSQKLRKATARPTGDGTMRKKPKGSQIFAWRTREAKEAHVSSVTSPTFPGIKNRCGRKCR